MMGSLGEWIGRYLGTQYVKERKGKVRRDETRRGG